MGLVCSTLRSGWQSLDRAIDVPATQDVLARGWGSRDVTSLIVWCSQLVRHCLYVTCVCTVEGCGLLADG